MKLVFFFCGGLGEVDFWRKKNVIHVIQLGKNMTNPGKKYQETKTLKKDFGETTF